MKMFVQHVLKDIVILIIIVFGIGEYTIENPKTITKCSYHFHLGCIYEWMERSENCPFVAR
ncbi:putative Zinc finger, RING/FYVE/PHD-type, Zinc finger, RING-H2-type [Helianthus anomalus]